MLMHASEIYNKYPQYLKYALDVPTVTSLRPDNMAISVWRSVKREYFRK